MISIQVMALTTARQSYHNHQRETAKLKSATSNEKLVAEMEEREQELRNDVQVEEYRLKQALINDLEKERKALEKVNLRRERSKHYDLTDEELSMCIERNIQHLYKVAKSELKLDPENL